MEKDSLQIHQQDLIVIHTEQCYTQTLW